MKSRIANIETTAPTAVAAPSWAANAVKKLAATALLTLTTLSFAHAQVADCAPGKLSDYEKLGAQGCMIGDKKFSNFQYHQGAAGLPSDAISLTPGTTPDTDDPGLLFEAKWTSASEESFVSYDIEAQPNGKPITGASLQMQFGTITGTGSATVLAHLCALGNTTDSCAALAHLCPVDDATGACGSQKVELKVVLSARGPKTPAANGQFNEPQRAIRVVIPIDMAPGSGGTADLDGFMAVFR